MLNYDLVVVGGGPAGLAATCEACKKGVRSVLLIERDTSLGGILNQCIHNGFGLQYFKEELTGPEYAAKFINRLSQYHVDIKMDTMVLDIGPDKVVHATNTKDGYMTIQAKAIILAMGCRERTRGAISIPGDRPAGVFTAGTAQRYVNIEGCKIGKRVVVLGSGDIGLIMARRMTLEGAKVLACVEIMPYSNGLSRNIVQCLNDYNIPLYLSHTIVDIRGEGRVKSVTIAKVDEARKPIPGTETEFECDTVLLSVGLIPENELSRAAGIELDPRTNGPIVFENMETSIPGIFACGNVVHVHDLADYVTLESENAGRAAARYLAEENVQDDAITIENGNAVSYTVPQKFRIGQLENSLVLFFRVKSVYKDVKVQVTSNGKVVASYAKEHMAPGEMQRIAIPVKLLQQACAGNLTVSVE